MLLWLFNIHWVTDLKTLWVILVLALAVSCMAMSTDMLRNWSTYPLSAVYFAAYGALSVFKWRFGAVDVALALIGIFLVIEVVHRSFFAAHEVSTDKLAPIGVALMVFGVAVLAGPSAYPGYPRPLFYLHLYPAIVCFGALAGAAVFNWWAKTLKLHPFLSQNYIAMLWFGADIGAGLLRNKGEAPAYTPWFVVGVVRLFVQMGCVAAWMLALCSVTKTNK